MLKLPKTNPCDKKIRSGFQKASEAMGIGLWETLGGSGWGTHRWGAWWLQRYEEIWIETLATEVNWSCFKHPKKVLRGKEYGFNDFPTLLSNIIELFYCDEWNVKRVGHCACHSFIISIYLLGFLVTAFDKPAKSPKPSFGKLQYSLKLLAFVSASESTMASCLSLSLSLCLGLSIHSRFKKHSQSWTSTKYGEKKS